MTQKENKKSELLELILEDTIDSIRKESDKKIDDLMTSLEANEYIQELFSRFIDKELVA